MVTTEIIALHKYHKIIPNHIINFVRNLQDLKKSPPQRPRDFVIPMTESIIPLPLISGNQGRKRFSKVH